MDIPLNKGLTCIVDDADYEKIRHIKWYACRASSGKHYIRGRLPVVGSPLRKWSVVQIARFIMEPPRELEVDHINDNPLDNRRANLQVITHRDNMRRRGRIKSSNPYKGIRGRGKTVRWSAQILVNDKRLYLGTYETAEEAARAYDAAAKQHFGKFARLNFPVTEKSPLAQGIEGA